MALVDENIACCCQSCSSMDYHNTKQAAAAWLKMLKWIKMEKCNGDFRTYMKIYHLFI